MKKEEVVMKKMEVEMEKGSVVMKRVEVVANKVVVELRRFFNAKLTFPLKIYPKVPPSLIPDMAQGFKTMLITMLL